MKIKTIAHVLCVSLPACVSAHAAEPTLAEENNAQDKPEEILVTAAPLEDILQPTQVLSGEELLLKSAPTIGETLANELGISSTYFGPAASRPVVRGQSGSRVGVLSNGTSALDVSDVSPDHNVTVEAILADRVELIRGPATLFYGSTAAGGLVNVTDGRIPEVPAEALVAGVVEARGDTAANEQTIVGRIDGGVGNLAWHFSGFARDTDNVEIPGFATADPAERSPDEQPGELANSYSEGDSFNVGLSWVGDRGYLGAAISEINSTYGLPGPEEEEGGGDPALFEGPFLDLEQTRVDVRGELRFDDGLVDSTKFLFGMNDYEHKEIEPSGEVATRFDNDAWQARLEATHRVIGGFNGAFGVQLDNRDFSAVGEEAFISQTDTDAIGVFLLEEYQADWGTVQLGARVESLEHDNVDFAGYDDEAYSFSAGVSIPILSDNNLIFNLSRTERNPNTEELYSNGAHIATRQFEVGIIANGDEAEKEVALNYEVGLERKVGLVTWEAWVYYYDYADYVYQDLTGGVVDDLPEAIYRQEDAEFYGAEAAVTFPLWQGGSIDNGLRLFGDAVRAELDDGRDLPRIPPWRFGGDFTFGQANWSAGLDVIYHAEQDDISSFNTDDYTLVGADFLYRLDFDRAELELFVRGDNLLDEEARKSTSFIAAFAPLPGVNFTAGLRGRF